MILPLLPRARRRTSAPPAGEGPHGRAPARRSPEEQDEGTVGGGGPCAGRLGSGGSGAAGRTRSPKEHGALLVRRCAPRPMCLPAGKQSALRRVAPGPRAYPGARAGRPRVSVLVAWRGARPRGRAQPDRPAAGARLPRVRGRRPLRLASVTRPRPASLPGMRAPTSRRAVGLRAQALWRDRLASARPGTG